MKYEESHLVISDLDTVTNDEYNYVQYKQFPLRT